MAFAFALPAAGQVAGTAYVEVSGPLCAAIRAELGAIGVPAAESPASASWSVTCGDEVRLAGPAGTIERPREGADDRLASEVAEYVRAQLLATPAARGLSTPPPASPAPLTTPPTAEPARDSSREPRVEERSASLTDIDATRREPEAIRLSEEGEALREAENGVAQERLPSTFPSEEENGLSVSMSVLLGGLISAGASFPALTLTAEPRVHIGDLSVAVHVGTSIATPNIEPLANTEFGDAMIGISLRSRFLDLGFDFMYAPRVASTPLRLGVGAGLSALRLKLTGQGAEELGLQDQTSAAWTAFPYIRAGATLRAHSRIQFRLEGRLGWLAREVVATIPFPLEPTLVAAQGVAGEISLGVEVLIQ